MKGKLHRLGIILLLLLIAPGCGGLRPAWDRVRFWQRAEGEEEIQEPVLPGEEAMEAPGDDGARGIAYRLKVNDAVSITLSGIREPRTMTPVVDEYGYIQLPYIDPVFALGKTSSELEREIRDAYIENRIYRSLTVNVVPPAQSYFVRGEVRAPGRYQLSSGITLMQAIAAAGGYTDYAGVRRVRLVRGGRTRRINLRDIEREPAEDIELKSDDVIIIPRSLF